MTTSSVPQGSFLGQLFFNMFILQECLHNSRLLLYTDDIKHYRETESTQDSELLQEDINSVGEWCAFNFLHMNPTKTFVISFSCKMPTLL